MSLTSQVLLVEGPAENPVVFRSAGTDTAVLLMERTKSVSVPRMSKFNPPAAPARCPAKVNPLDERVAGDDQFLAGAQPQDCGVVAVSDLIAFRLRSECLVSRVSESNFPTAQAGNFQSIVYKTNVDAKEHLALIKGKIGSNDKDKVLVRMHSECLTGDVFGSERCDCGEQIFQSLKMISQEGKGVLVYMQQEGRGIGLTNKIKAYALQDKGFDTVEANLELGFKGDLRDYGIGAQSLRDIGVKRLRLLTNNPRKIVGLQGYGLTVVERVPLEVAPKKSNIEYLRTKQQKLGHLFSKI